MTTATASLVDSGVSNAFLFCSTLVRLKDIAYI